MPKVNRTELLAIEVPNPALEIQRERGLAFAEVRASLETVRQILGDLTKLREQVLSSLLFGSHEIPASYDRFLEEASS